MKYEGSTDVEYPLHSVSLVRVTAPFSDRWLAKRRGSVVGGVT